MTRTQTTRRSPSRLYPVLGLAAALVIVGLLVLSWRAASGVPGAASYRLTVEVPDSNRLIRFNQVRIGGVRVGQVEDVEAVVPAGGGRPFARVELKLDSDVGPLPSDTTIRIRPASILGATYVDLVPGRRSTTVATGGTLPLEAATRSVELTDLFDVFDQKTSRNAQQAFKALGGGLVGRGDALGSTITNLAEAFPDLRDVAQALAADDTRFGRLIAGYRRTVAALDAVGPQLGTFVTGGARTMEGIADARGSLGEAIDRFPPAADATTRALANLRPAVDGLADIAADIRPAARMLPDTLVGLDRTLDLGATSFSAMPRFSRDLDTALVALRRVSTATSTDGALRKLRDLFKPGGELLEWVAPAQVHCNFLTLSGNNFYSMLATTGPEGGPSVANAHVKTLGSSPLEALQQGKTLPNLKLNYLARQNEHECESNNEPAPKGVQVLDSPAGLQSKGTPPTAPPSGVLQRAEAAGLLRMPPEPKP